MGLAFAKPIIVATVIDGYRFAPPILRSLNIQGRVELLPPEPARRCPDMTSSNSNWSAPASTGKRWTRSFARGRCRSAKAESRTLDRVGRNSAAYCADPPSTNWRNTFCYSALRASLADRSRGRAFRALGKAWMPGTRPCTARFAWAPIPAGRGRTSDSEDESSDRWHV
jgi:hypothetical protein